MSSYFVLELDTTPPAIDVYVPQYTTPSIETEMRVVASEELDQFQEIYFVDSMGIRHDVTFQQEEKGFVGIMKFNEFPLGMTQIYARVRDEVFNVSRLVSKAFVIREAMMLEMYLEEIIQNIDDEISVMNITMNNKHKNITTVREKIRIPKIKNRSRKINVDIEDNG